jgi:hypothetical protein
MIAVFTYGTIALVFGVPLLGFLLGPRLLEPRSHRQIRALALAFERAWGLQPVGEGHVTGAYRSHVTTVGPNAPIPARAGVRSWYFTALGVAAVLAFSSTGLGDADTAARVFAWLGLIGTWMVTFYVAVAALPTQAQGLTTKLKLEVGLPGLPDVSVRPHYRDRMTTADPVFDRAFTSDGDEAETVALLGPSQRAAIREAAGDWTLQGGELTVVLPPSTPLDDVRARLGELCHLADALTIPHDRADALVARFDAEDTQDTRVLVLSTLARVDVDRARELAATTLDTSSLQDALEGPPVAQLSAVILLEDAGLPSDIPALSALRETFPTFVSRTIAAIRARVEPGALGGLSIAHGEARGGLTEAARNHGAISRPERP